MKAEEEEIRKNPALMNVLRSMCYEMVKNGNQMKEDPKGKDSNENFTGSKVQKTLNKQSELIKSPSDTTIYAPAIASKGETSIRNDEGDKEFVNDKFINDI